MSLKDKFKSEMTKPTPTREADLFGNKVIVKGMTGAQFDEYAKYQENATPSKRQAYKIVMSVYDPDTNERVFADSDIEWIASAAPAYRQGISLEVDIVNGWADDPKAG